MSKITIVGFIAIVCVNFQTVRTTALFGNALPLLSNPLLNNPLINNAKNILKIPKDEQKIVENLESDAVKFGEQIVSNLSNELNKLKQEGERILNGVRNIDSNPKCNKLFENVYMILSNMASDFYSCVLNKTQSASSDMINLTNSAKQLQKNFVKDMRDMSQCFSNPTELIKCITQSGQNMNAVLSDFEQLITAFYDLTKLFPDLRICYVNSHFKHAKPNVNKILNEGLECLSSIF